MMALHQCLHHDHRSNLILLLLAVVVSSVGLVSGQTCPLNLDESQGLVLLSPPPPPVFPDFMTVFQESMLRIQDLRQDPRLASSESCAKSVNWSEFNSRLCESNPLDLDSFCSPTSTARTSVTTTTHVLTLAITSDAYTVTSERKPFSVHANWSDISSSFQPLPSSTASSIISNTPQDDDNVTEVFLGHNETALLPADASPVVSTSMTGGSPNNGAFIAIGVACGLTLLFIVIIVVIIATQSRYRRLCPWMVNPFLKAFQRQTSDALPFTSPPTSAPTTPVAEINIVNVLATNNNHPCPVLWTEEKRTELLQGGLLTTVQSPEKETAIEMGHVDSRKTPTDPRSVKPTKEESGRKGFSEDRLESSKESSGEDTRALKQTNKSNKVADTSGGSRNAGNSEPNVTWETWDNSTFYKVH